MTVLHLAFGTGGGAGIAARRLHLALLRSGHASQFLTRFDSDAENHIFSIGRETPRERIARLVDRLIEERYVKPRRRVNNTLFTLDYAGIDVGREARLARADILHLHWTSYFLSVENITALARYGRPVVMTLHDMWAFTGGCHYSAGCGGYTRACERCPQISDDPESAAHERLQSKKKGFQRLAPTIVSPSKWLADIARSSVVFSNARIEVIPNGLDCSIFSPQRSDEERRHLRLEQDAFVIGFAAIDRGEKRKGLAELEAAIVRFAQLAPAEKVALLSMGASTVDDSSLPVSVIKLDNVRGESDMARYLAACDVVVVPSLEDNLPNVMIEAMASGVPVVAFAQGGALDAIVSGETGLLVPPFDIEGLALALAELAGNPEQRQRMARAARARAERLYSSEVQAEAYARLYAELVEKGRECASYESLAEVSDWPFELGTVPASLTTDIWQSLLLEISLTIEQADNMADANRQWALRTEDHLQMMKDVAKQNEAWAQNAENRLRQSHFFSFASSGVQERLQQLSTLAKKCEEWALETEERLKQALTLAKSNEDWAKNAENRLKQALTLAKANEDWALRVEELLTQARQNVANSDVAICKARETIAECLSNLDLPQSHEASLAARARLAALLAGLQDLG